MPLKKKEIQVGEEVYVVTPVAVELDNGRYKAEPSLEKFVVHARTSEYHCECCADECGKGDTCGEDYRFQLRPVDERHGPYYGPYRLLSSKRVFKGAPDLSELVTCHTCAGWGQVRSVFSAKREATAFLKPVEVEHVDCMFCDRCGFVDEDPSWAVGLPDDQVCEDVQAMRKFDEARLGDGTRGYKP